MTTGPLGQGLGSSVGMAIAAQWRGPLRPARVRPVWLQRLRAVQRWRPDGRGRLAKRPRSPDTCSCRTCAGSTTTTISRSKAAPSWLSAKTSPSASADLGWQTVRVNDANDLEAIARALETFQASHRPADPDRGAQRHRLGCPAQGQYGRCTWRAAGPADEVRLDQGGLRLAGRRAVSWCPTKSGRSLPAGIGRRGAGRTPQLAVSLRRSTASSTRTRPRSSCAMLGRPAARRLGPGDPHVRPTAKDWPPASSSGQGAQRGRPACPLADRRFGRSGAVEQHAAEGRPTRGISARRTHARAATCTSAFASTAWRLDLQRPGAVRAAALLRHVLCVHRLHATGACGWPPSCASRCSTS